MLMSRLHLPLFLAVLLASSGCATLVSERQLKLEGDAVAAANEIDKAYLAQLDEAATPSTGLDPYEAWNRPMHRLNSLIDRKVLGPAARIYVRTLPEATRKGVSNVFRNLVQPITALNLLLEGRPEHAATSVGRFALNSTAGIGGVFDVASLQGIPFYSKDFGETFGRWGWVESNYLVVPLFGPGTVRDSIGKVIFQQVSPVSQLANEWGPGVSIVYGLDARAQALPNDAFVEGAEDEYLLVRDAYLQRRRCQLVDCSDELPAYLLPDYEYELPAVGN